MSDLFFHPLSSKSVLFRRRRHHAGPLILIGQPRRGRDTTKSRQTHRRRGGLKTRKETMAQVVSADERSSRCARPESDALRRRRGAPIERTRDRHQRRKSLRERELEREGEAGLRDRARGIRDGGPSRSRPSIVAALLLVLSFRSGARPKLNEHTNSPPFSFSLVRLRVCRARRRPRTP